MAPQQSSSSSTVAGIASIIVLGVDMLLIVLICLAMTWARAEFMRVFEDFEGELPVMTILILSVPALPVALALLFVAVLLVLKEIVVRNTPVNLNLNVLVGTGLLAFALVLLIFLFLPLISLMQKLS